jgi:hypothetical protein
MSKHTGSTIIVKVALQLTILYRPRYDIRQMIKTTTAVKKYQNALLIGSEVPEKERSFFLMSFFLISTLARSCHSVLIRE